jgi:hypothetical protein
MMCIGADAPLGVEERVRIVALCREHELLRDECAIAVPEDVQPVGIKEWLTKHLLRRHLGRTLGDEAVVPNGGASSFDRGVKKLEMREAGAWLESRARELGTDFLIGCDTPAWREDSGTQGFRYAALSRAKEVIVGSAYDPPSKKHAGYPGADGRVGEFFDILSLCAYRHLDGRIAASSPFVKALKKELKLKVTCRALWW